MLCWFGENCSPWSLFTKFANKRTTYICALVREMILSFIWQYGALVGEHLESLANLLVRYQQQKASMYVSSPPEERHCKFNMGNVQNRPTVIVERTIDVLHLMARIS